MMPQPDTAPTTEVNVLASSMTPKAARMRGTMPEPVNRNMTASATSACMVMMGIWMLTRRVRRLVRARVMQAAMPTPPTTAMTDETAAR